MKVQNILHWTTNKQYSSTCLSVVNLRHFSENIWDKYFDVATKKEIESIWSKRVNERRFDRHNEDKVKRYILSQFPYPSGNLHMGHIRVYTISDTLARFNHMKGRNVFQPMGWDAFGLPAENAAIERQIPADQWTLSNIANMKSQLQAFGFSFDWDAELTTCHPNYYKWTQHIILKLFHAGLLYQKDAIVNWDPVDETVLADEQVDQEGNSWRSGAKVEKKVLKQWFIKTTAFAKSLYDGLDKNVLKNWDEVLAMQRNWIGKCDGYSFNFNLVLEKQKIPTFITVWIRNPEHLNNIQYLTVLPGSMLDHLEPTLDQNKNRRLSIQAENPINGSIIPIFVSDTVTYEECQDVKAGLPEIFPEDNLFAQEKGIETKKFDSMFSTREEICNYAMEKNIGGYPVSSRLRDWLISRQRYWGTPIPLVDCENCAAPQPIPYDQLPVMLPPLKEINFHVKGVSPLASAQNWVQTTCPSCGGQARRVTDTIDTFVDSSWYYLRYTDASNEKVPFDPEKAQELLPVDIYIGGKEHAVLHLYYARFMNHFLHSLGWVPNKEPFHQLLVQGMMKGKSYRLEKSGRYLRESDVTIEGPAHGLHKETGEKVLIEWEKMSKSKGNGVDPEAVLAEYGVDTTRLLVLDQMTPASDKKWDPQTFRGVLNWQSKVWQIVKYFISRRHMNEPVNYIDPDRLTQDEEMLYHDRNKFIKSVGFNYSEAYLLNTVISRLYTMSTTLRKCASSTIHFSKIYERTLADMIIVTAPMAPHFAAQLWEGISSVPEKLNEHEYNWSATVFEQRWPVMDEDFPLSLIVKVNSAVKHEYSIKYSELQRLTKKEAIEIAVSLPNIRRTLSNKEIIETIYTCTEDYDHIIEFKTKKKNHEDEELETS